jgi:hypothetical protein
VLVSMVSIGIFYGLIRYMFITKPSPSPPSPHSHNSLAIFKPHRVTTNLLQASSLNRAPGNPHLHQRHAPTSPSAHLAGIARGCNQIDCLGRRAARCGFWIGERRFDSKRAVRSHPYQSGEKGGAGWRCCALATT